MENQLDTEAFEELTRNRVVRQHVTRQSHLMFFHVYFPHYVQYPIAEFQKDIFRITEDTSNTLAVIVAFRGSGKSTLVTFSYSLWAILGTQQKKFVLMFFQTRTQAKQHMMNLKRELESNALLKSDLGPFEEESDEWGSSSLVFSNTGARITVASMEQSIRGLRHNQHRPDLIICDDVEDMASVKMYESRQKTYQWLTGEVIPGGALNTRLIVIGNLLHDDSLVMRLKRDIEEGQRDGVFKMFPLLSEKEKIAWPGKYPTVADIEVERKKSGNQYSWQREYLLRIVPDEDQVIHPDWIHYYDELPKSTGNFINIAVGIDLAISQKDTADYTAMVSGIVTGHEDKFCLYILPNPINKRLTFPQTIDQIKAVHGANHKIFSRVKILVEDVGYQRAVIDQLAHDVYGVEGIKVSGDKRSRLMTVSAMIQNGKIKFPKHGCEDLIRQIVGFGVERHDDLVDAFTIVAHHGLEVYGRPTPRITFIDMSPGLGRDNSGERTFHPIGFNTQF